MPGLAGQSPDYWGTKIVTGRSPRPRYNDLWIAAQAVEHGYPLMTINVADFADLPGAALLTPTHAPDAPSL